ncbi:putative ribonuclease-like protein YfkH [Halobacillus andaensis]|uniref:Ribonuclease-like protein YfkH n=1 Tax=Halobacillus andaensis TaxID=1176239 RepID=A0A917B6T3_HALAA|nr:YihY/virulence factor BrkB family protein [Halobacillus andaensis]MBP2005948.1 membrane protein [Halobacillus andaensis]GGF24794.1 putative ribonuclease-like protein YfkH [Halobacillus andaensis]
MIRFSKELFKQIGDNDVPGSAAQLAYFFLLSLFPFMIFLITLLGYLNIDEERALLLISTYAPPDTYELISENVTEILRDRNSGLLSIGILGTLWAASNGVNTLIKAFNRAHSAEEERSFFVSRVISILLTIAMIVVIGVAFLLPVLGSAIGVYVFSIFGLSEDFLQAWETLRWVISSIVFFIVLSFLYLMAPDQPMKIKEITMGALFATVGWQLVSLLFSFYVENLGNYSATYGSLGGVIVLMIWFYLSGIVILIGGEINALIHKKHKGRHPY